MGALQRVRSELLTTAAAHYTTLSPLAAPWQVGFHDDKLVKRAHVQRRLNEIVNRLNKTQVGEQGAEAGCGRLLGGRSRV